MLRPLRREDIDIEAAFVTGLSPESRHNRLLGGIGRRMLEKLIAAARYRDDPTVTRVTLEFT